MFVQGPPTNHSLENREPPAAVQAFLGTAAALRFCQACWRLLGPESLCRDAHEGEAGVGCSRVTEVTPDGLMDTEAVATDDSASPTWGRRKPRTVCVRTSGASRRGLGPDGGSRGQARGLGAGRYYLTCNSSGVEGQAHPAEPVPGAGGEVAEGSRCARDLSASARAGCPTSTAFPTHPPALPGLGPWCCCRPVPACVLGGSPALGPPRQGCLPRLPSGKLRP